MPSEEQSIPQVSRETGIPDQTIRNWVQKCESGILPDGLQESSPRFMSPKKKYQLVLEAAGIDNEQLGGFLRERGLHSEHIMIWDQELREMIDKKGDKKDQELQRKEKALAEAAALLLLKKKLDALMGDQKGD